MLPELFHFSIMTTKKTKSTRRNDNKGFKQAIINSSLASMFQRDSLRFVVGLFIIIISLFLILAFSSHFMTGWEEQSAVQNGTDFEEVQNYGGRLGAYAAYYFMDNCFGASAYIIPIFFLLLGVKLMNAYKVRLWKCFIHCGILLVWISITLSLLYSSFGKDSDTQITFNWGGKHGQIACDFLTNSIGLIPTYAIVVVAAIYYMIYLRRETISVIRSAMKPHALVKNGYEKLSAARNRGTEYHVDDNQIQDLNDTDDTQNEDDYNDDCRVSVDFSNATNEGSVGELELDVNDTPPVSTAHLSAAPKPAASVSLEIEKSHCETPSLPISSMPYNPRLDLENYKFPGLDLLKKYPDNSRSVDMVEQNANKDRIIKVLHDFGVEIVGIKATIGPTITLYEITPAPGVRISKIRNLEDDIALSLSALGIRIIAPIPGKGTIGVEVPNKTPHIVSMESIINSRKFQESTYELPIAIGKTITNEVFMVDLAKMPHLLVAGATGQGKSVGLNAIITSLLYKKHPSELKFVMVDPKKVEFSVYSPIENHFLARIPDGDDAIITDVTKVVQTLKSLCQLMDHRYDLLKRAKARNIKEYNAKFTARQLNPENGHEYMPYIVIIIDEFGDLIMTAGKEVELPIARIAQLARAVGMHMVIATQRPTTNIITGTIKANFPARMAFKVSQRIDSQTILDRPGANQLIGKGDLLFLSGNSPVRVQCAFVDTPEVEAICSYIAAQQGYPQPFALPEVLAEGAEKPGAAGGMEEELDPLFRQAAELIVTHQQGSTSLIQRKFSIGYNRAGRLMDQLERAGIVGPTRGAKPREVLITDIVQLDEIVAKLS